MTNQDPQQAPRNAQSWAKPVDRLSVGNVPSEAINLNVAGKRLAGPLQGFGQLWQKTYRIDLQAPGLRAADVVKTWKARFPEFWPKGNNFYGPATGVAPGEVAVLNLAVPGGMKLSTGIRVIYADDESFSFMTPEGHTFAGMITFGAEDTATDAVRVQIQALIRASDAIYEMGCRVGLVHKMEDKFWHGTLANLAAAFNTRGTVTQTNVLVDRKLQWSYFGNVWHNAAIRTALYTPVHLLRRLRRS